MVDKLRPILTRLDPAYLANLDRASKTSTRSSITMPTTDSSFNPFDQVTAADLKLLQARLRRPLRAARTAHRPARTAA